MSYKGDKNLAELLSKAGETRSVAEIKSIMSGIIAAPPDIAAPDLWLQLFHTKNNAALVAELKALKKTMMAETPVTQGGKLAAIRAEMEKLGVDGFLVPRADQFQGEYVPAANERLAFATNFTGSAGSAVILKSKAAFFTDGRYTLQAREEVDAADFQICSVAKDQAPTPTITPMEWIEKNLSRGAKFGIDPWIHTPAEVEDIRKSVAKAGGELVLLAKNPLDLAWQGRPAQPLAPVVPHPLQYAGKSSEDKRQDLVKTLEKEGVDALAVMLPEEVCWLLNVRGGDVPCTPFALSYLVLHKDGTVDWFVDQRKLTDETNQWIGPDVRVHDLGAFTGHVRQLATAQKKVWIDPKSAPIAMEAMLSGYIFSERSPIQLMKARKNPVEIQGSIEAHIRDGVAETRFLAVLSDPAEVAKLDELAAADILQKFRQEGDRFRGLSFDSISGAGGNGAIVHYRSSPETNKPLNAGPIYLIDSGGQYLDGTTDITRTVAVGPVTAEMKEHVTRVLKGHIQVALSVFPEGTTGDVLDFKARAALKEVGLDYAHGTGHGVGSYLSVHEGPTGISERSKKSPPLQPGMIISNEPGFYKEGAYGIRLENLVVVVDTSKKDTEGKALYGFKTLTMAPFDRNLVDPALLTDDELKWLNDYHAEVKKNLLPRLQSIDPKAAAFLKKATQKITRKSGPKPKNGKKCCP